MYIDDREYLTPPNNEAIPVLQCFFCDEYIYAGDTYYRLDTLICCEDCLEENFRFTAELPDLEAEKADMER